MSLPHLLRRTPAQAAAPEVPLASVLAEFDIYSFDRESVERYKIEKKKAVFPQLLPKFYGATSPAVWHQTYPFNTLGLPVRNPNSADPAGIMNKAPDATLKVDALERKSVAHDPCLAVKLGAEEYYIEVWDEATSKPSFS